MRGATMYFVSAPSLRVFQSTRPMRGATCRRSASRRNTGHFKPRAPCGARPFTADETRRAVIFQSTRPMRGATLCRGWVHLRQLISIHAPHAGRDFFIANEGLSILEFQSTRPMRGATHARLGRRGDL